MFNLLWSASWAVIQSALCVNVHHAGCRSCRSRRGSLLQQGASQPRKVCVCGPVALPHTICPVSAGCVSIPTCSACTPGQASRRTGRQALSSPRRRHNCPSKHSTHTRSTRQQHTQSVPTQHPPASLPSCAAAGTPHQTRRHRQTLPCAAQHPPAAAGTGDERREGGGGRWLSGMSNLKQARQP